MPKPLYGHTLVPYGNDLVAIGGGDGYKVYNHEIYKLSCSNGYPWISGYCQWTQMRQEISVGRTYFVAIPIPDYMVDCKHSIYKYETVSNSSADILLQ